MEILLKCCAVVFFCSSLSLSASDEKGLTANPAACCGADAEQAIRLILKVQSYKAFLARKEEWLLVAQALSGQYNALPPAAQAQVKKRAVAERERLQMKFGLQDGYSLISEQLERAVLLSYMRRACARPGAYACDELLYFYHGVRYLVTAVVALQDRGLIKRDFAEALLLAIGNIINESLPEGDCPIDVAKVAENAVSSHSLLEAKTSLLFGCISKPVSEGELFQQAAAIMWARLPLKKRAAIRAYAHDAVSNESFTKKFSDCGLARKSLIEKIIMRGCVFSLPSISGIEDYLSMAGLGQIFAVEFERELKNPTRYALLLQERGGCKMPDRMYSFYVKSISESQSALNKSISESQSALKLVGYILEQTDAFRFFIRRQVGAPHEAGAEGAEGWVMDSNSALPPSVETTGDIALAQAGAAVPGQTEGVSPASGTGSDASTSNPAGLRRAPNLFVQIPPLDDEEDLCS